MVNVCNDDVFEEAVSRPDFSSVGGLYPWTVADEKVVDGRNRTWNNNDVLKEFSEVLHRLRPFVEIARIG